MFICDDSSQIRHLISAVLRPRGYELREFANAEELLDGLEDGSPDLVILDVHMPGIDGLTALKQIRGNPTLAETRVLLLTGTAEAREDGWAERVGADRHLLKPFAIGDLGEAVQQLLAT